MERKLQKSDSNFRSISKGEEDFHNKQVLNFQEEVLLWSWPEKILIFQVFKEVLHCRAVKELSFLGSYLEL